MFGERLTVIRPGSRTTRGGDTIPDWAAATTHEVDRVEVQPNTQTESATAERGLRITGYRVISEPGTDPDIRATDRVRWRGSTYEVSGEVGRWHDDFLGHVELVIERTEG